MPKYINADEFLHYYGILIHRPDFNPQSAEIETWKVWKKWFDEEIRLLVSKMATEKNDEEKFLARIKDIPVLPLPSDDVVEVKHGEWIELVDGMKFYAYECSVCCKVCTVLENSKYNFCPNCGAKMSERKETNE